MSERQFTAADREVVLRGGLIDAIRVFRVATGLDLITTKRAVERIRAGELRIDEFLHAVETCPRCQGKGVVPLPENEAERLKSILQRIQMFLPREELQTSSEHEIAQLIGEALNP